MRFFGFGNRDEVGKTQFNLKGQSSDSWSQRSKAAVSLLQSVLPAVAGHFLKIADLGCGDEKIKSYLKKADIDFEYTGYDLIPQGQDVRPMDLNMQFPDEPYDAVFCMGVLEYITDMDSFFARLNGVARYAVISYTCADSGRYSEDDLHNYGWLHHYRACEMESFFSRNGFENKRILMLDRGRIALWLVERTD